jgi:hypothetical protein
VRVNWDCDAGHRWHDIDEEGMKRIAKLTATERGVLVLAICIVLSGAYWAVHPQRMYLDHNDSPSEAGINLSGGEEVSEGKARIYGILGIVFGGGLVWCVFARE